jgi:hypothetical protein
VLSLYSKKSEKTARAQDEKVERRQGRRVNFYTRLPCLLSFFLLLTVLPAFSNVLITVDEALKLAFPASTVKRQTIYLSKEQIAQARKLAGVDIPSALVYPYVAMKDGEIMGIAYFDAHVVRTLPETIMMTVNLEDRIQRIEVLDFNEPRDYVPKAAWYQQFVGQRLDDDLALKRNIRSIAGATLTARHTTDAVRRMMALHHVIKRQLIDE